MAKEKISCRFNPVVGMEVAVCYDGKWGRAVRGQIVKPAMYGFVVRFLPWANENAGEVEMNIVWHKKQGLYGGWLAGRGEAGIMAGLGACGDWYSVLPTELLESKGYWPPDKN